MTAPTENPMRKRRDGVSIIMVECAVEREKGLSFDN
jgi:hypothetical protein